MKSEMKLTGTAGIMALMPIFMDMMKGGAGGGMSEKMMLVLLGCVTVMVCGYNLSRGWAKQEEGGGGGKKTSEFKMSAVVGGAGVLQLLLDMMRGGEMLSERVKIALMVAVTFIAMSFTISRGMAKTEKRTSPPAAG